MSGFARVAGSRRVGSVVARPLSCGWVWACRPLPSGGLAAGFSPAPACVFVPFVSRSAASSFARAVSACGWRAWLRSGSVGSPVFAACGLGVPAFAVKVALPVGWSCRSARVFLSSFAAVWC